MDILNKLNDTFNSETFDYEIGDISELHGQDFKNWIDDVDEYRYLGYNIEETCKHFKLPPKVVRQFDKLIASQNNYDC